MFRFKFGLLALVATYLILSAPGSIRADTDDPVLLTVELPTAETTETTRYQLSLADLTALPVTEFTTTTNWTSGTQKFTGVALNTLLGSLEVTTGQLEMIAINDYSINMAVEDPTNRGALIAYLMNDEVMTPRDKGPLWLVYDFDSDPTYQTETIYSRSIWQLDRIIVSR